MCRSISPRPLLLSEEHFYMIEIRRVQTSDKFPQIWIEIAGAGHELLHMSDCESLLHRNGLRVEECLEIVGISVQSNQGIVLRDVVLQLIVNLKIWG